MFNVNSPADLTWLFIRTIAVLCVVYDLIIIYTYGPEASISHVLAKKSMQHPTILFAAGLLCGHLFVPIFTEK